MRTIPSAALRAGKAARIFGPRDLRIVDVPVSELGPHEVRCRVVRSGICATDYAIYTGEFSAVKKGAVRFPLTPGHEWSGVVEETGAAVARFQPGDRVVGDTSVSCGICYDCLVGEYYKCTEARAVGTVNAWDGAYAEYIVMPERHLFDLPDTISFDQGAMVEPAATALYAVRLAKVTIGDTVLVHGTGPIGIMAAKLAKLSGAARVLITGRKPSKLNAARAFGADVAINTTQLGGQECSPCKVAEAVRAAVGPEGVDKVIEASGSVQLFEESLEVIKPGGVVAVVAFYETVVEAFDLDTIVLAGITLRGVAGSLGMYRPVLGLMASGMFDPTPLITGRYAFAEVHRALHDMQAASETRIKLMLEIG